MEKHTSIKSGPNLKIEIFAMLSHLKNPEISISNAFNGHKILSKYLGIISMHFNRNFDPGEHTEMT